MEWSREARVAWETGGGRILNETASALLVPITHQGKGGITGSHGRSRSWARASFRGLPCSMLRGRQDVQLPELPTGCRTCGSAPGLRLNGVGRCSRSGNGGIAGGGRLVARRGRHGVVGAIAGPAEAAWRCGEVQGHAGHADKVRPVAEASWVPGASCAWGHVKISMGGSVARIGIIELPLRLRRYGT